MDGWLYLVVCLTLGEYFRMSRKEHGELCTLRVEHRRGVLCVHWGWSGIYISIIIFPPRLGGMGRTFRAQLDARICLMCALRDLHFFFKFSCTHNCTYLHVPTNPALAHVSPAIDRLIIK